MRNRIFLIATLVAASAGAAAYLAAGRDPAPAGERVVLAFGDSVAAGQGLGPALGYPNNGRAYPALVGATLGWPVHNVAISSACAATAGTPGAHPDTPATCTVSILGDQIARARQVFSGAPRVVLVTVGANDIRFADCGLEAVVPSAATAACDDETLGRRLDALSANLSRALAVLRDGYPRAAMVLTAYYNPMPEPAADGQRPCEIFEPLAGLRRPLSLVSDAALDDAARELQAEVHDRFQDGVRRLNAAIAGAARGAGASVATLDFRGHDLCRDDDQSWVYGPDYDVRFDIDRLPGGRRWRGTLPDRCPQPTPSEPAPFDTGEITRRIGPVRVTYAARVAVNCMPHPTAAGQRAIARAIARAIPDRAAG